jgi:carbonic anhydrase
MESKKLNLHGWVYDMGNGGIKVLKTERPQKTA